MLGVTFYHSTIRKIVTGFGTIFNDIHIQRRDITDNIIEDIKVPLAYGPKEKFIVRLDQDASINNDETLVAMTLPRIGFEMSAITYDSARKMNTLNKTQKVGSDPDRTNWQYERVPYNIEFTLSVMVKNTDDGLQIIEQILPFFTPDFNIVVKDDPDLALNSDIPITLNSISSEEEYEGDFDTRRVLTHNLTFTARAWIYPPTNQRGLIKRVIVQSYPQTDDLVPENRNTTTPGKELVRVVVVPNPITADADDDFTFTVTQTDFFV